MAKLLRCATQPLSKQKLLAELGLSNANLNYKCHIVPLLEQGLIAMKLPDAPKAACNATSSRPGAGAAGCNEFQGAPPYDATKFPAFIKPLSTAEHGLTMTLFSPPTQTTLHYRIVTPMFLGGENQQADATQFRNASFKGALRFWWRALNWGQAFKDAGQQPTAALQLLHQREGDLFGLASDGKNSRQSRVQIQSDLQGAALKLPVTAPTPKKSDKPLEEVSYLLGQGLFDHKSGVTRQYLEGGNLTIRLNFKLGMSEADIQSVEQAAIALGLFGGLGSRARKGLGSLALHQLERPGQPVREFATVESIAAFIQALDFSAPADAPLSAFTRATRIDVSASADKALDALEAIGNELQLYRGYGRKNPRTNQHEVNGQKALKIFDDDHHNVLDATKGGHLQQLPKRAVFGLPHNYFFSSIEKNFGITTEDEGRRASPLLVHIHPLKDGKFVAIQTLLPGVFLPDGMKVEAKGKSKYAIPESKADYAVITRYLDGFANKKPLKAPHHG